MAESAPVTYEKGKLYNLNIADVQPDPDQPRKYFDEQALSELKASIEKHGVLQPVLVRQGANGGLLLVSGERRYQASALAGREIIPAVFTDGEPADIDVRDPQYLRYDAKKSVEDAARNGISTFCMTLDPRADQYVSRIFGAKNYMVVDQIARLPEKLPLLYAGLTR